MVGTARGRQQCDINLGASACAGLCGARDWRHPAARVDCALGTMVCRDAGRRHCLLAHAHDFRGRPVATWSRGWHSGPPHWIAIVALLALWALIAMPLAARTSRRALLCQRRTSAWLGGCVGWPAVVRAGVRAGLVCLAVPAGCAGSAAQPAHPVGTEYNPGLTFSRMVTSRSWAAFPTRRAPCCSTAKARCTWHPGQPAWP